MATPTITRTYPEANPYDELVLSTSWLLTSLTKRQELYGYLRELPDAQGQPGDVGSRYAQEIAAYTWQRVGRHEFSEQETTHINIELNKINQLYHDAYATMRDIIG